MCSCPTFDSPGNIVPIKDHALYSAVNLFRKGFWSKRIGELLCRLRSSDKIVLHAIIEVVGLLPIQMFGMPQSLWLKPYTRV